MVTNERQYRISKAKLRRLHDSLEGSKGGASEIDPRLRKAGLESIQSQIEELTEALRKYESLKKGEVVEFRVHSLSEIPGLLVYARVGRGLTQADLARRLKMKPQQIQRYEATEYRSASVAKLLKVAQALGITLEATVELSQPLEG